MKLRDLEMVRYKLEADEYVDIQNDRGREYCIYPLAGSGYWSCEFWVRKQISRVAGVFAPPDRCICIGGLNPIRLIADQNRALDVVVISCSTGSGMQHSPINPEFVKAKEHTIGSGFHERRVYEMLGKGGPSSRLRVGETHNVKGGWSSWPRHSFDSRPELAAEFEEIFLCFTRPKTGRALIDMHGTFSDGSSKHETHLVTSGDMLEVPLGDHPIVAYPDTDLVYIWAYVSPVDKIYGKWAEEVGTYE